MKSIYLIPLLLSFNAYASCIDANSQEITKTIVKKQTKRTQEPGRLVIIHEEELSQDISDASNSIPDEECLDDLELVANQELETDNRVELYDDVEPLLLNYQFDKYKLTKKQVELINRFIYQGDSGAIVIEGHADSQGEEDYNNTLSFRRASEVRKYIEKRFGDEYVIKVVAYGESEPECSVQENKVTGCNRRVNVYFSSKTL